MMTAVIEQLRKSSVDSYQTSALQAYAELYTSAGSDIAEAYTDSDYSETCGLLLNQSKSTKARAGGLNNWSKMVFILLLSI